MYIVKSRYGSYICGAYLNSENGPTFEFCTDFNDAHQFDDRATAEAIAFLAEGEVLVP